jgi:hypothetical protein
MDPFSITAGIVGITAACLSTAKSLNSLRSKCREGSATITAICSEATVISASLSHIQALMIDRPTVVTARFQQRPELMATFDTALIGCMVMFSALDEEIKRIAAHMTDDTELSWKGKVRFVWREDTMKELLSQMRGQQTAITLLTQLLQMQAPSVMKTLFSLTVVQ